MIPSSQFPSFFELVLPRSQAEGRGGGVRDKWRTDPGEPLGAELCAGKLRFEVRGGKTPRRSTQLKLPLQRAFPRARPFPAATCPVHRHLGSPISCGHLSRTPPPRPSAWERDEKIASWPAAVSFCSSAASFRGGASSFRGDAPSFTPTSVTDAGIKETDVGVKEGTAQVKEASGGVEETATGLKEEAVGLFGEAAPFKEGAVVVKEGAVSLKEAAADFTESATAEFGPGSLLRECTGSRRSQPGGLRDISRG